MKFKKELRFDSIEKARSFYCHKYPGKSKECNKCELYSSNNGYTLMCPAFCKEYPHKAAQLMGFEVIEEGEDKTELQIDICSMTLAQAKEYCIKKRKKDGIPCREITCSLFNSELCGTPVYLWNLDRPRLAPEELEICRALGAKWVSRNDKFSQVWLWVDKPEKKESNGVFICYVADKPIATVSSDKFQHVKPGDCISVEDLI